MLRSFLLVTVAAAAVQSVAAYAQTPPGPAVPPADTSSPASLNDGSTAGRTFAAQPQSTSPGDGTSGELEEITVTAQRRSENLQSVPIAVSAVTGTQLSRIGVKDLVDMRTAVPTLNLNNTSGNLTANLRGVGSNAVGPGVENAVALYIDGVYYGSTGGSLLSLNNIAQVEVLKGPQGTLFGRNATGGLIQVTTREPTQDLSGQFGGSYANYQTFTGSAYIAGGLTENLRADLAVQATHQGDGYGTNGFNGKDIYKVDHDISVRSKIVFTPTDLTKITLIGDYTSSKNTNNIFVVQPGTISGFTPAPGNPPFGVAPDTGYNASIDYQPVDRIHAGGGSIRIQQDIGSLELVSTTAYRRTNTKIDFDYDGSPQKIEEIGVVEHDRQVSQELQIQSKGSGPFKWVAGAFYYRATAAYAPASLYFYDIGAFISIYAQQRATSLAGYVQGTYEVAEGTNITLGGRYTTEKRVAVYGRDAVNSSVTGALLATDTAPYQSKRYNKFTFRIAVDHRLSQDIMAYASFNRGFKSGGYSVGSFGSPPYAPETLDAYEVGIKSDLLDQHLRVNLAGYYYDYRDLQVQRYGSGPILTTNGAKAKIYGIDADVTAVFSSRFEINGGFGLQHPEFSSYPNALLTNSSGPTSYTFGSAAGNLLPLAARFLANLGSNYKVDVHGGSLDLNGNIYYNSGFATDADNTVKQHHFAQLGASATWTAPDQHFSVGLFGRNLTNKRVLTDGAATMTGHLVFYAPPRTYGVTAGYKF